MKKETSLSVGFNFAHYLKAFLGAFLITVIISAIISALFAHTDIPDSAWGRTTEAIGMFSAFLAALFSAAGTKKRGYLTGMLSSLCYSVLLLIIGVIIFPGALVLSELSRRLVFSAAIGAIGGIFGINLKRTA